MPNINIINWAERRIKCRHKARSLRVTIKPAGFKKWFRSSIDVSCLDINRYGVAIDTNTFFKTKDKLVVGFKGKYISHSNIQGIVTDCVKNDEHYRISIAFCYALDSKNYCRKTDNALSRIESLYNQKHETKAS